MLTVKNKLNYKIGTSLIAILLLAISCSEDYELYDTSFSGIYFQEDSIYYSFGVTPLNTHSYALEVPVRIMGEPVKEDRHFSVSVVSDKSTAKEKVHYEINKDMVIPADSINGFISITLLRDKLGEEDFKIYLKLEQNETFTPVYEKFKEVVIHYNNRVERPQWKDWQGNPTWPNFKLGAWHPLTYIKFIEFYRNLEQLQPETFKAMEKAFGPDLKNVEFGWPWDYDYTMTKFVLIPLYKYFMEEHPEHGIKIPKPAGY